MAIAAPSKPLQPDTADKEKESPMEPLQTDQAKEIADQTDKAKEIADYATSDTILAETVATLTAGAGTVIARMMASRSHRQVAAVGRTQPTPAYISRMKGLLGRDPTDVQGRLLGKKERIDIHKNEDERASRIQRHVRPHSHG
jgi:hypothetical protein